MLANLFACTGVVTSIPYDFGIESITLTTGFTYTREFGVEVLTQGEVTEYCVQAETEVESQCEWLPEPIPNSLSLPATITTQALTILFCVSKINVMRVAATLFRHYATRSSSLTWHRHC
jgi:hypothetical protein